MIEKTPLISRETLIIGMVLFLVGLVYLALVIWRFQWLKRSPLGGLLLRWGKGGWSFPATRLGAFAGGLFAAFVGCWILNAHFTFLAVSEAAGKVALVAILTFLFGAMIHDFIRHWCRKR